MCLTVKPRAHVACNYNYLFENEGLFDVTGSRAHGESGNISETVQSRDVVTTDQ